MANKIKGYMIETALSEYPETRDDDLVLGNKICQLYGIYILFENRIGMGNAITRARRKFNQRGLYLSENAKVLEHRKRLEKVMMEEYTDNKKELHEQTILNSFV